MAFFMLIFMAFSSQSFPIWLWVMVWLMVFGVK